MKRNALRIIITIVSTAFFTGVYAQAETPGQTTESTSEISAESDLDAELSELMGNSDNSESESKSVWEIYGYFENENSFAAKTGEIIKLEARARSTFKYGDAFQYALATLDIFFYPENTTTGMPRETGKIYAYEAYIALGETLKFKIGKQVFNWGVADSFRVTNYLDSRYLGELFFTEEDERYTGSFAVNVKYLFSDYAVEIAVIPQYTPYTMASTGSYWNFSPSAVNGITPTIDTSSSAPKDLENISTGIRAGGTLGSFDFHLSYFHGINNNIVMVPYSTVTGGSLSSIELKPLNVISDKVGFDSALTVGKFALRTEILYSPNQGALHDTETEVVSQTNAANFTSRTVVDEVPYLAYTLGFDVNLWGKNGQILMEYTNSNYLSNPDDYQEEFFSNFLLVLLKDKWFDEKLEVSTYVILRPTNDDIGYIPMLSFIWDLSNGIYLTLGGMLFVGNDDDMISMFNDKDMVYFRCRMNF